MQSVTLYFNASLFRGSLRRAWPLWFGYTLIWFMILPLPLLNELADRRTLDNNTVQDVSEYILRAGAYGGIAMACIFGIFFAMTMFAYLTSPRSTQGFHSMPARRETLYISGYLAGLTYMLSTLVLAFAAAGITTLCFDRFDSVALGRALLAAVFTVMFFYSFGVVCMMFTGQILAAPVFYGILNILAVGMEYLVQNFAGNFLYGYGGYSGEYPLDIFSPVFKMATSVYVSGYSYEYDSFGNLISSAEKAEMSGLWVLGAYAAAGVLLALLGLLVYRRRASEASGSTVAIAWARPIFKYGVALCAAFSLGQLIYLLLFGVNLARGDYSLAGTIACMLFAGLLGYFAAEMLLKKSFRVWRSGRAGALVFSVVLVCFGVGMSLDLTGYEGYVPAADEIQSVRVDLSVPGESFYGNVEQSESIELVRAAHYALIADKDRTLHERTDYDSETGDGTAYLYLTISYTLTDGRVVRRTYDDGTAYLSELDEAGSVAQTLTALINCPEATYKRVFSNADYGEALRYHFTGGYCQLWTEDKYADTASADQYKYDGDLTAAQVQEIVGALERDRLAGHASNASIFRERWDGNGSYANLELWYIDPSDKRVNSRSLYITVTDNLTETVQTLRDMEIWPAEGK